MTDTHQSPKLNIVVLGLSITSSWGNGHATTYRALLRELHERGHDILFLERDQPWYAENRDMPNPLFCRTELYADLDDLKQRFAREVCTADFVIVGSYVPEGVRVGQWIVDNVECPVAFYDIDTPVTIDKLGRLDFEYISPELIPRYDLYLSFTGGPILTLLEHKYGSPAAFPLYCCVDPFQYYHVALEPRWDLAYMGTYSADRQPALDRLLTEPAKTHPEGRFAVAGSQYPPEIEWPANVERIDHLLPAQHRDFYNSQRYTLNVTRADMVRAGYCPSVRLFEAAACGTPIISDYWQGLDQFFEPKSEILIARDPEDTLRCLRDLTESERLKIGERARMRVMEHHTAASRAAELEAYLVDCLQEINAGW